MSLNGSRTEELLRRAGGVGDPAYGELFERHRARLRRMVASVFDRRLASRVDPSDVVQEALADAGRKLPDYLRERPVPFYPWLRRLALRRLVWWRRFHLRARKRSVALERNGGPSRADASTLPFLDLLPDGGTSPSGQAVRSEEREWVRTALGRLSPTDRDVLVLRYIEGVPFAEIAERLGLGLSAVKMRHLRAMERLSDLLEAPGRNRADD
jgi:RNA polymerase sigma-70 factor (ECF subfamily)